LINFLLVFLLQAKISRIDFTGNHTVPARYLRGEIFSKKNDVLSELNLAYDVDKIVAYYRRLGFFKTTAEYAVTPVREDVVVTYSIQEGSRPRVERIVVIGGRQFDPKKIRRQITVKIRDRFLEDKIRDTRDNLGNFLKDSGYPFANVSSIVNPDSGILTFQIDDGGFFYVRDVVLKGLKSCRPAVVRREIEFERGSRFSRTHLRNSQRRIYGLGFFGTVDVELLRGESDSLDLVFTVRELKSRLLNFGVGLSVNPQAQEGVPLSFLMSFGLEEMNLFNLGHRLLIQPSFRFGIPRRWDTKIEGRYTIPYITPARLTFSALPFYWLENTPDYVRRTRGAELRVTKFLRENIQVSVANQYKLVDYRPKTDLPDTFKGVTNSLKILSIVDMRDDFFNPRQGLYLAPLAEYAGGFLGGENNYLRLEIEQRFFFPFLGSVFAQRLRIGGLHPIGAVAPEEKFYLGGQYTLRGYSEKSLGPETPAADTTEHYGNYVGNLNLECRFRLPFNFGLVVFGDLGFVDNLIDLPGDTKAGAGFGLRFYTPIGPLRGDLAVPVTPLEFGKYKVYFGFYNIF
jgi:outer membrane protein assembly complex protein YaeT